VTAVEPAAATVLLVMLLLLPVVVVVQQLFIRLKSLIYSTAQHRRQTHRSVL